MPLALTQRRWPTRRRTRFQRRLAAFLVRAQPRIDGRSTQPVTLHHCAWRLSLKHALDRHPADGLRALVAQCASVNFHESQRSIFKALICRVNYGLLSNSEIKPDDPWRHVDAPLELDLFGFREPS